MWNVNTVPASPGQVSNHGVHRHVRGKGQNATLGTRWILLEDWGMDISGEENTTQKCESGKSQYNCRMTASSRCQELRTHDKVWGGVGNVFQGRSWRAPDFSSGLWGAGDEARAEKSLWEEKPAEGRLEKEAAKGLPRRQ